MVQCEAPKIAFSWFITPITMVYGTYNYSYWGFCWPTNITGGPHIVMYQFPACRQSQILLLFVASFLFIVAPWTSLSQPEWHHVAPMKHALKSGAMGEGLHGFTMVLPPWFYHHGFTSVYSNLPVIKRHHLKIPTGGYWGGYTSRPCLIHGKWSWMINDR